MFFLSNPVPFKEQSYQKQKEPETSDQSFFRLQSKSRKMLLLVIYYLTKFDDIIQSGFWVIPKITSANLCEPIHDINYSTSICPVLLSLESAEKKEKLLKFEYLENEKSFVDEINIFHSFWRAIICWKNKKMIKNSGHKL